jgi:dienelactone hydrolase
MHKIPVQYNDGKTTLEALVVTDRSENKMKPVILVFHSWKGRDETMEKKGELLASLGYVAFIVDLYGKGIIGSSKEHCAGLMTPFMKDRALLRARVDLAYATAKALPGIDPSKVGAIGYCFGGLCALDLARAGADLRGVVSFHGLLGAPHGLDCKIKSKVMCLHGHDDPMVSPDELLTFMKEMTDLHVDFQVHIFGRTMHAFSIPEANDPDFGTVYSAQADQRAWLLMKNFFDEIFS